MPGRSKMFPQAGKPAESGKQYQGSAEIREDACPTDAFEGAVGQTDVMNQEDANRQQRRAEQECPRDAAFGQRGKSNPRLDQREQQGQIAEIDQVDVRIDLGAAIFEQRPHVLKICLNRRYVLIEGSMSRTG